MTMTPSIAHATPPRRSSHKPPQQPIGLTPIGVTRPPQDITPASDTRVTPQRGTQLCTCGCRQRFTPNVHAPHQRFFNDACRKRAHRRKQAQARPKAKRTPILALATCAWCGCTFFAHAGKGATHCKPSHRTAAAKCRRAAAIDALIGDLGSMNADEAALFVERQGMRTITRYLHSQGWRYDDTARAWVMAAGLSHEYAMARQAATE